MTKEPNKDFREAVRESIAHLFYKQEKKQLDATTDRILALCKEMLVHDAWKEYPNNEEFYREHMTAKVHNSARQHLLKQLGEKI